MKKLLLFVFVFLVNHSFSQVATITTGTITGSPFCVTNSVGATLSVSFTSTGTYNSGNIYKVQLSNTAGNFPSGD